MNDRELPFDFDAEVAVLSAMMGWQDATARGLEMLKAESFYRPEHRKVFQAIGSLFERSETVDPITMRQQLERTGDIDSIGGMDYLLELSDAVSTGEAIEYHAKIVHENAQLRSLIHAGTAMVQSAYKRDGRQISEIIDAAQQSVFESIEQSGESMRPIKATMMPAFAEIEKWQSAKDGMTGIPSGLYDLDEMTGGWQPGNLVVIAGRPSMGKTAMVVGSALQAALHSNVAVGLFTLEMSKEEIVHRMLCHEALVDMKNLRGGRNKLQAHELHQLMTVAEHLNRAPIWIDDSPALSVMQLRAKARRLKLERPDLGLVIVDYIQLMTADAENRTQEVSVITRGLKALAKEMKIPVIALSQLSRGPEARSDKRPIMSDLRESGSIEQDADVVAFLYRPEYYGETQDTKGNSLIGAAELIIGKQRNGPTGTVRMYFRKECTRFENAAVTKQWSAA